MSKSTNKIHDLCTGAKVLTSLIWSDVCGDAPLNEDLISYAFRDLHSKLDEVIKLSDNTK